MELKKVIFRHVCGAPVYRFEFQAFAELQEKQIDTAQKLRIADLQIETLKRNKQHAIFTER